MIPDISSEKLRRCLAAIPELELKGTALIRQGGSVPREKLREAVLETIQYTNRCRCALSRLAKLPAIPQHAPVYGL